MAESVVTEGEIDLDHIFDEIPEDLMMTQLDPSPISDLSNSSPDSLSFSIGEIERLLMEDGGDKVAVEEQPILEFSDGFWSDFLLDSPVESDHRSAGLVDLRGGDKNSNPSSSSSSSVEEHNKVDVLQQRENDNNSGGDGDDPIISKKHQRQLRNRDAAVRSRERKKMYVRDLELKSKYLEGECRRLGMLLQCCSAENQALRLSLQSAKAFDASMTKQESAVLLLESLLLGSLLWFLGIVCLLILPGSLQLNLVAVPPENVGVRKQGSLAPRKAESKIFGLKAFHSFMVSKRCKASRSRMKPSSLILQVQE